jgi:lipopolysaccharide biosynthesis glycosyltransferase
MEKPMKTAVVTMVTGDEYLLGAEVLFHSLRCHGMTAAVTPIIIGVDKCDFAEAVPIPTDYSFVPVESATQFVHNAKKFFALTLPYDRIICIDSDMLCIGEPGYLWSDSFGSLPFYAVRDTAAIHHHPEVIRRLYLDQNRLFNCGLYVYHPALLPNMHDDLVELIRAGALRSYSGGEQGYLNHYMQYRNVEVGFLPPEYNYCMDEFMPRVPLDAIRILHFAGDWGKPWNCQFGESDWRSPWIARWWKECALMVRNRCWEMKKTLADKLAALENAGAIISQLEAELEKKVIRVQYTSSPLCDEV